LGLAAVAAIDAAYWFLDLRSVPAATVVAVVGVWTGFGVIWWAGRRIYGTWSLASRLDRLALKLVAALMVAFSLAVIGGCVAFRLGVFRFGVGG